MDDLYFMQRALELAKAAGEEDEVPVGAVLVREGRIIGEGANAPISLNDATAHAEINALRVACKAESNYRLPGSTLYVTLEPCAMCAGAIVHARVARVVIAAREPRAGAGGSVLNILQNEQLNHCCAVDYGLMGDVSGAMLQGFFRRKRLASKLLREQLKEQLNEQ